MCDLLQMLTPFNHYNAGQKIYIELEDIDDITFITRGKVAVGYHINMRERYPLELTGG